MRKKLLIVFGVLIFFSNFISGAVTIFIARKAIIEKIQIHLKDKAVDTAEIVDCKILMFLQFLEGLARMPVLQDSSVSYPDKIKSLWSAAKANERITSLNIMDIKGNFYTEDGKVFDVSSRPYFKSASAGKFYVSAPYIEIDKGTLVNTLAVPIFDVNNNVIGVLSVDTPGTKLSEDIDSITVGQTGYCFILTPETTIIAHKEKNFVLEQTNLIELAKSDKNIISLAEFAKTAIAEKKSAVGYYNFRGQNTIGSYAHLKTTEWVVVVKAPVQEFMNTIQVMNKSMWLIGNTVLIIMLFIVYMVAKKMVKPLSNVTDALKDIALGEGDLTVRLPAIGNDEVAELSEYFNQTIEKIGLSIKTVEKNSTVMEEVGEELSSDMSQTASTINEISSNINGIKDQAITQAASVTETASTIEEIIRTIEQLNNNIEHQSSSVVESSAAIEEMVANIASITHTLEKTDNVIKNLASATSEGRTTLQNSNIVTKRIEEESGGLIEASNVIQNIAEQTNLLAMNAAIEAAHAGESGKGFAVVADEIRKLAEESSVQGKTITDTLKNLSNEIKGLADSSKIVEEKFNSIFTLSENVRNMSAELTNAMREQENGSKEVLSAIKEISRITAEVKNGSEEMFIGGKSVSTEMEKLDELTIKIKDRMNEMSASVIQINNAVHQVNNLAQQNKDSVKNMVHVVRKFKT